MEADVVLGQPDFNSSVSGTTASLFDVPFKIFSDGVRLFLTERGNDRVLMWNSIPTSNNELADLVLGQPDFTTAVSNNGGRSAIALADPYHAVSDGKRLFVTDFSNCRILIWNSIPTTIRQPADLVLGQSTFSTGTVNQGGLGAGTFGFGPSFVFSDGRRLFVADRANHRVLIWNSMPTVNKQPADLVLGQPDFVSATPNNGGLSARSISQPRSIFYDGERLFVGDENNNRVLIWNTLPTSNYQAADVVVGQPNFTSSASNQGGGAKAHTLGNPSLYSLFSDGQRLYVADAANHRVLIWNDIPVKNNAPADIVIGQSSFSGNLANRGGAVGANTLDTPRGVAADGNRLFIVDEGNQRVLIFNLGGVSEQNLGPQFDQGKSVLGKVFWDVNGNGRQDEGESGVEGVKVASDTGVYAITDEDGKYHYPFIETGQRVLKIDESTVPVGARHASPVEFTTENPRKVMVTEGMLTKVSFGIKPSSMSSPNAFVGDPLPGHSRSDKQAALDSRLRGNDKNTGPLLKVSVSQDAMSLEPRLGVSAALVQKEGDRSFSDQEDLSPFSVVRFTIDTNYHLFIKRAELKVWAIRHPERSEGSKYGDSSSSTQNDVMVIDLPMPLPLTYDYELLDPLDSPFATLRYQLSVFDENDKEDRTSIGELVIE